MKEEKPVILNDYSFIKDIGEGNFGKVKLSTLDSTKEKFAIKILDKEKLKSQTKSTLYNEIEIISTLKHPNIVYVDKILEDEKNYYIIMEFCEKGELFDYIVEKERLCPEEASFFFYQIINGVEYIHKQGFVHRDLKPENLLLTKEKILKIIDFGLCHNFNGTKFLTTKCGSPSYAAPEILKGFPYDGFKTDIWCCGIILYAMLCGYLPFDGDDNQEIFQSIVDGDLEFPNFLEDDSIDLLLRLLNPEPKERISIEEIKYHPFYLKGKYFYMLKYGDLEEDSEDEDEDKNNEMKNNNFLNINLVDKKGLTTIKRKKESKYTFNNIKRIKENENKNVKNNIYQNILNNIKNATEEDDSTSRSKKKPDLITSFNKKDQAKIEKIKISKIEIDDQKTVHQNVETETNNDKSSSLIGKINNKFLINNYQKKNEKKDLSFIKNNNNKTYKLMLYNNQAMNPNLLGFNLIVSSPEKKLEFINKKKNINILSLDMSNPKKNNSLDKRKNLKIVNKHNNKFLNEKSKNISINKLKEKQKQNIKDIRLKTDQLDFFQKFVINKNKAESLQKSPVKNAGINCNLILTNDNIKDRLMSGKQNKVSSKDRIILTQKKRNFDSIKKDACSNNKHSIVNSPAQNINNIYQRNFKKNKILNSIFGNSNQNINKNGRADEGNCNSDKINIGCRSCSIKKENHRKNLKIDVNKKLNNLKIVNLNTNNNTIKKDSNSNFIYKNHLDININNNLLSLNAVLKTEPKNNHFLEKVIQKINSNKDRKTVKNNLHLLMNNNDSKNDDNKQIFRFLSLDKSNNNKEIFGNPLLFKNYKNSINEDDKINKKSSYGFKDEKQILNTINQKIIENNINRKTKDRVKKIFPNLLIHNKK